MLSTDKNEQEEENSKSFREKIVRGRKSNAVCGQNRAGRRKFQEFPGENCPWEKVKCCPRTKMSAQGIGV